MNITLPAIYEQGVLRPLSPLALPEASQVNVRILDENLDEHELSFQRCLTDIHGLLSSVEENWLNPLVHQVFSQLLEPELRTLWRLAPTNLRELCSMLVLAATHITQDKLTREQVDALSFGIDLLTRTKLVETDLDKLQDRLTLTGLPPAMTFDDATVQSYLDEL